MIIHSFYCTINAEVLTLGTSLIFNFLHAYHVYRCRSILCKLFVSFKTFYDTNSWHQSYILIASSGYFTKWKSLLRNSTHWLNRVIRCVSLGRGQNPIKIESLLSVYPNVLRQHFCILTITKLSVLELTRTL